MNFISCQSCGVVIDFDVQCLKREKMLNHDQDKVCEAVRCPMCHGRIPNEEWISVRFLEGK